MKPVTIFLDKSIHAQYYNVTLDEKQQTGAESTLVHNTEFDKVKVLVEGFIPKSEEDEKKENLHNTITILGTRGSGKTSFLLTIKNELSKNEIGDKIEILEIIDPTLIEEKGHVFLNVIAAIKDLIDKKLDKQECNPENQSGYNRKGWRASLNKLAAGLPSIDGIGNNSLDSWQDAEFVMDNGLKAVHASKELAKNFNEFLRISLKILNKKAFLLMFDDIDVDATKGWAVLETIRKYFTGARLITIVSGDSQLYSTVVRQKKWQNFGQEILKYEGKQLDKLSVFNSMITELESQYLQKVLQPKNRIHLSTIGTCKRYNEEKKFYVYEKSDITVDNNPKNEIENVYERILKYFGINSNYQAKAYSDYLLELPLRTQVQFLNLFKLDTGEYNEDNTSITPFTDIFLSDLYAKEIDINTAIRSPKNINRLILNFLLREKKLEELYQLQPITTEDTLNASLLSLNFLLSYNIQKDPYLIFDYFLKIGYTRNLLPLLGYKNAVNDILNPSIEDLCNTTVIFNDNVLKDVVGKITAYIRGTIDGNRSKSERVLQAGTIPLFGLASTSKKSSKSTSDRIDSVLKNGKANYIEQMLIYMPLSSNQYVYKQTSLLTYSPYLLLGTIGELIRKHKLDDLKNGFTELSQFRGYMMPDFVRGNNKEEIDNIEEESQDLDSEQLGNSSNGFDFESVFRNWVEKYPKKHKENTSNISVQLLGKIATRFFYALTNLESKVGNKNLGEVFHAYILAFMNAVLVEDCRENANELASQLNLNNTNYSDTLFIYNINKLITKDDDKKDIVKSEKLSFSQWLLSCPLLLVYLNKNDKIKKSIRVYCYDYLKNNNDTWEELLNIDLRKFLDEIPIRKESVEKVFNLDKNKISTLSIDNIKNYGEIKDRLQSFDISILDSKSLDKLKDELGKLGLKRISFKSVEKFKNYLENN
ncbi:hypothetical protein ABS768_17215 [Flavobacterium sp. ST-75]|uniref:KAP NTPase domain-containing protein n=1 Tax=Flavobacterium rhizophilum TaxID=3163296 RepID=A0ABW8YJ57_9FLAO